MQSSKHQSLHLSKLESDAREEVNRCKANWDTMAFRAVDTILKKGEQDSHIDLEEREAVLDQRNGRIQGAKFCPSPVPSHLQVEGDPFLCEGSGLEEDPFEQFENEPEPPEVQPEEEDVVGYALLGLDDGEALGLPDGAASSSTSTSAGNPLARRVASPSCEADPQETPRQRLQRLKQSLDKNRASRPRIINVRASQLPLGNLNHTHTLHHCRGIVWC